jgi:hypothetical protein
VIHPSDPHHTLYPAFCVRFTVEFVTFPGETVKTWLSVARACVIVGWTLFSATVVHAQSFSFSPNVGLYIPTQEIIQQVAGGATAAELQKQEVGLTLGGRMALWFGSRVGLEATGAYAPSRLRRTLAGTQTLTDASLFTGSGRLTVNVLPPKFPLVLAFSGGAAVINRAGAAYADITPRTDIGFSSGVSFGFRLGSLLSFVVSGDNFLYKPKFALPGLPAPPTQNDINLSFGLGLMGMGMGRR